MNKKRPAEKHGTPVDWGDIYNRLEAAGRAIERGWEPAQEDKKKILKARAKELAVEQAGEEDAGESIEVVEFLVAYERYGIESSYVREVYPLRDLTPLPGAPAFVTGIVNVRGRITSVVDIKKFFDIPDKGLGDFNKLVIIRSEGMELSILADVILGIRKIRANEMQTSLPTLTGIREDYLRGVTSDGLVVLDAEKILTDKGIVVDEHDLEEQL